MNPIIGSVVIGPHSCLTGWVFDVVKRLASNGVGRPVKHIDRDYIIDVDRDGTRPIYITNYPSPSIIDAIDSGDIDVILIVEAPHDVTAYLMRILNMTLVQAIRSYTATSVANLAIGRAKSVLVLDRDSDTPVSQMLRKLVLQLDLLSGNEDVVAAAGDLIRPYRANATASLENVLEARADSYAPRHNRSPYTQKTNSTDLIISEVLDPLIAMAQGPAIRPVIWPASVFEFGDKPGEPPPKVADVSGPSRNLYFGPYLHLPPARYRVEALLRFSEEIKDVPFTIEVHGATFLANVKIEHREKGAYRGYFIFDHVDPVATLEIRMRNDLEIPHGWLSLIELRFFVVETCLT